MHTHRVYVFHIADRNAGVSRIAHDLILKLFPSEDAFFDENLADSRLFDPAFDYILQLSVSSGYTASPTSKSVRRPYYHWQTQFAGQPLVVVRIVNREASWDSLSNAFHRFSKLFPILRQIDSLVVFRAFQPRFQLRHPSLPTLP